MSRSLSARPIQQEHDEYVADDAPLEELAPYSERSTRPLTCLLFLLPLIVCYELGTRWYTTNPVRGTQHIVAFTLLQKFFTAVGAHGRHLPALAVAGILLAWHIARNDRWRLDLPAMAGMAAESFLLAFPLFVIHYCLVRYLPAALLAGRGPGHGDLLILSIGAGVYEELVFRLVLLTLLSLLIRDIFRVPDRGAHTVGVLVSAVLFSSYHYLGAEPFETRTFIFRTLAGIYFGVLFFTRGFGITAASHAFYDILLVLPAAGRL